MENTDKVILSLQINKDIEKSKVLHMELKDINTFDYGDIFENFYSIEMQVPSNIEYIVSKLIFNRIEVYEIDKHSTILENEIKDFIC